MSLLPLPSWSKEQTWATFETGFFHGFVGEVELQKCAEDLDRYDELIQISQPDLIIETGTRAGGSALWFESRGLQVITIDINPEAGAQARKQKPQANIHYVIGSSINIGRWPDFESMVKGKRVMVSLDSDHLSPHVQAEIGMLAQFVTPGCYLVVEDACFDMFEPEKARKGGWGIPQYGGPLDAVNKSELVWSRASGFWRDEALEGMYPVSHSPCGWWRRND